MKRTCAVCGRARAVYKFRELRSKWTRKVWRSSVCRDCTNEKARLERERHHAAGARGRRRCSICELAKGATDFPSAGRGAELRRECSACWSVSTWLRSRWGRTPTADEVRAEVRRRELHVEDFTRAELDGWELRLRAYAAELRITLNRRRA